MVTLTKRVELQIGDIIDIGGRKFKCDRAANPKTPVAKISKIDAENIPTQPTPLKSALKTPTKTPMKEFLTPRRPTENTKTPNLLNTKATPKSSLRTPLAPSSTMTAPVTESTSMDDSIDRIFTPLKEISTKKNRVSIADIPDKESEIEGMRRVSKTPIRKTPGKALKEKAEPIADPSARMRLFNSSSMADISKLRKSVEKTEAKEPIMEANVEQVKVNPEPIVEESNEQSEPQRQSLKPDFKFLERQNSRARHARSKSTGSALSGSVTPLKKKNARSAVCPHTDKILHNKRKSLSRISGAKPSVDVQIEISPEEEEKREQVEQLELEMEMLEDESELAKVASVPASAIKQFPQDNAEETEAILYHSPPATPSRVSGANSTRKNFTPKTKSCTPEPVEKSRTPISIVKSVSKQVDEEEDVDIENVEDNNVTSLPSALLFESENNEQSTNAAVRSAVKEVIEQTVLPVVTAELAPTCRVLFDEIQSESKSESAVESPSLTSDVFEIQMTKEEQVAQFIEIWEVIRELVDEDGERLSRKIYRVPAKSQKKSKLYYEKIENPSDLLMLKKRITEKEFGTFQEFSSQFQEIFNNARVWNEFEPCEENIKNVAEMERVLQAEIKKRFFTQKEAEKETKTEIENSKEEEEESSKESSSESSSEEEAKPASPPPARRSTRAARTPATKTPKSNQKVVVEKSPEISEEEEEEISEPKLTAEKIGEMKVVELKAELKKRGISGAGLKADLVKKLWDAVQKEK